MKTLIPSKIFLLIHDYIYAKCQKESGFDFLGKGEALYGFGRFKDDRDIPSIRNQMIKHPEIATFIEKREIKTINGKYLYDRMREAQKIGSTSVSLTLSYLKTYMKFIGFDSYDAFIHQMIIEEKIKNSDLPAESFGASHLLDSPLESILYYTGYYYSLKNSQVQSFELEIDTFKNELLIRGLHDSFTQIGGDKTAYIGEFEKLGDNLWAELFPKRKINKISLLIHNQQIPLEQHYLCRGIISTISTFNSPFCCETLIAQKIMDEKGQWIIDPKKDLPAKQYLNLQHKSTTIPAKTILHKTDLLPQNKPVAAFESFIGYYMAWSFAHYTKGAAPEQIKLYKSKIVIHDNCSAQLISAYGHDENSGKTPINCYLSLTDIANVNHHNPEGQRKISITNLDSNSHIKSHALMTVPPALADSKRIEELTEDERNAYTYLKGVYCSFGNRKSPFLASALIFERLPISQEAFDQIEVGTFFLNELDEEHMPAIEQLQEHYDSTTIQAEPENEKAVTA